MQIFPLISVIILILLAIIIVIVARRKPRNELDPAQQEKRPRGYWMGIGISIGIAIGAGLGPAFDNFGVGIGVGIAIGVAIGSALERRYENNLRPLTEDEQKRQRIFLILGLVMGILLLAVVAALYLLRP